MISGTMSHNKAIEQVVGNAEAGTEGYGGAVYAAGGNVYIGIERCNGENEKHSITYTDLAHPFVSANEAVFGGALAVNGGSVYVYCGDVKNNKSNNEGTGMNVFMTDGEDDPNKVSEFYHYLDSAEIGEPTNHGMVSVGGKLNVIHGDNSQLTITITYFSNEILNENGAEVSWEGTAPQNYHLNLPYCPSSWQDEQTDKMFVGWTESRIGTAAQVIRNTEDYEPIGKPVDLNELMENETDQNVEYYAVWAPLTNYITYKQSIDGVNIISPDDMVHSNPTTYTCSNVTSQLEFTAPTHSGYTFKGWKIYASNEKISNWNLDANTYPATLISHINPSEGYQGVPITLLQNFGDIVMVAVFEPAFADLKIVNAGSQDVDAGATYVYTISGQAYDGGSNVNMQVVIPNNGEVTIKDLPVGDYTITEAQIWSWRYIDKTIVVEGATATTSNTSTGVVVVPVTDPNETVIVTYTVNRKNNYWLDDYDFKEYYGKQ